ncbi:MULTISPECIES: transcription termination/antitermination protein NusG [Holospora]|uniref:Transcription termination/antitermination protein NusG n=2 Tax=Holospora TaxID=44747 RepID=A0A061JHD7_9PROT|nr:MULTISPECIES: transcription termination/antitermination protein NusG [Holospora]ETZ04683.1 transcription termination/antitermination protein NusG [Holospora undulata HU1]GAJ46236.1 transcription termination/antitermination protein NusG [Holospora elegans E1]
MATIDALRWYILRVVSNAEASIALEVEKQLKDAKLWHDTYQTLVVAKKVEVVRRGIRQLVDEKLFPGYVFVRLNLTNAVSDVVRNTARVLGFLGNDSGPQCLSDEEVDKILHQASEAVAPSDVCHALEVGKMVRISGGLFSTMEGMIESKDLLKQRVKVSISILGRLTAVELGFDQVEIIEE